MDTTIVITSSDLADYTTLSRKRQENIFRREFMVRKGAKPEDDPIKAIDTVIKEVEARLGPVEEKLKHVDLLTIVPRRADILAATAEINKHSKADLDEALQKKGGPVYELLRKRAALTRVNYERREDIARLTILLNLLPRPQAESFRTLIESSGQDEVDVSGLTEAQQQEAITLLGRLGMVAYATAGKLTLNRSKVDGLQYLSYTGEVARTVGSQTFWVPQAKQAEWDENEKHLGDVSRKIQLHMAKRQAGGLSEEEHKEFEHLQGLYLELRNRRNAICAPQTALNVSLPRVEERKAPRGEVPAIDFGPTPPPA